MDANSLITLFGQEAGTSLALGEAGTLALAFEGGPTLQIEHDPALDVLHCYAVLGAAPADPARGAALCRQMLEANAFGRDTGGATLGLDAATGEIILSRRLELAWADTAQLRAVVESMAAVAQDWRQRLDGAVSAVSAAAPPAADTAFSMHSLGLRA